MSALGNPDEPPEVRLKDLRAGLLGVHVLARVVTVARKEITRKSDGHRTSVLSGLLSDGTATVRFTWWDPPAEGVDQGTVLRAVNAQVREFRQRPELSFTWSTRIQPASDLELPSFQAVDLPLLGVGALHPGAEGFRLDVRVTDVTERIVTVGQERRTVHSGRLADGTGSIPFTAWVDFRIRPGDALRVAGAYVRAFRGKPEVTLDERSHVEALPSGAVPSAPSATAARLSLGAAEARGGAEDSVVEGLVVALVSPSGVVSRCPTCSRVLQEGVCRLHGAVEGTPDLRARLALDDGTGVVTVNLTRELTEKLTGRSLGQHQESLQRHSDPARIEDELRELLLARRFRVRGRVRLDDFGLSMFANGIDAVSAEPEAAIEVLARRLAEGPR
ncbi:MAG: hypothetical protein L3K14_08355 [Thermoplasmata archaeon]|nr:hypothetical protein [Thermoplasmata archaeon]